LNPKSPSVIFDARFVPNKPSKTFFFRIKESKRKGSKTHEKVDPPQAPVTPPIRTSRATPSEAGIHFHAARVRVISSIKNNPDSPILQAEVLNPNQHVDLD